MIKLSQPKDQNGLGHSLPLAPLMNCLGKRALSNPSVSEEEPSRNRSPRPPLLPPDVMRERPVRRETRRCGRAR
ncbi:hypothetical protein PHYPO_G00141550 [Pangasianodon hypophthalmus]|uniref:Uncharacterized protein n=1 Tax=Pangasianodon hypophthalmus TaxID=310915 RepID=A0A5N5KE02_PANHP|nr:hypothetical protein PHYPO_G00141550 [Pangasianodon hypophthalmus]